MTTHTKICGIRTQEHLHTAVDAGAKFIGFVHFAKSPRHLSIADISTLLLALPEHVQSVVVCVNPDDFLIAELAALPTLSAIQLHGSESVERAADIKKLSGKKIIKAIAIATEDDLANITQYEAISDYILLDAKTNHPSLPGGVGQRFDWKILTTTKPSIPWFLAGGIGIDNVEEAIKITQAPLLDLSSSVESAPGVKDSGKIRALLEKVAQL